MAQAVIEVGGTNAGAAARSPETANARAGAAEAARERAGRRHGAAGESTGSGANGSAGSDRAPKRVTASSELFTMMEVCREADMTYQTLKFYCNQGLVPNVKRDKNNRRVFDEHDVEWVKSLVCLKKCGMSIDEMRAYLELCLQGEASILERKVMLAEKRARLIEQIAELEASVDYIDWKQGFYDDVLAGRTEYFSNLVPKSE